MRHFMETVETQAVGEMVFRALDKREYLMVIFLICRQNHML